MADAAAQRRQLVPFAALSATYFAHIGFFNPYLPLWLKELGLPIVEEIVTKQSGIDVAPEVAKLRRSRPSLVCDLVEPFRCCVELTVIRHLDEMHDKKKMAGRYAEMMEETLTYRGHRFRRRRTARGPDRQARCR